MLIFDQNNEVVYLGDETLKYLRSGWKRPFFYPPGKPEKGDVLIFFSRGGGLHSIVMKALGISEGQIAAGNSVLLIESIHSEGALPVVKLLPREDCTERILLDTIYERKSITIKREDGRMDVIADGQILSYCEEQHDEIMVLLDDNGVKYFTPCRKDTLDEDAGDGKRETSHEELAAMLEHNGFAGYYDRSAVGKMDLRTLLDQQIYAAVAGGEGFVNFRGRGVSVSKEEIDAGGTHYYVIFLQEEENLIEEIIWTNWKYTNFKARNYGAKYDQIQYNSFRLWGSGERLRHLEKLLQKGSATNATILLTGESGTGKTFLAREIHHCSKRKERPFVHINCAAIPYQLLESELFGYEEGAFTGAKKGGKAGLFDMAYGGTLFLDEIGELPLSLQGKLLEVMQSKTFFRVGGTTKHQADVRFIAATNKNLRQLVKEKRFREDLYYRINVFPIEIPPLRQRIDAIQPIVSDILPEICERLEIEPVLMEYETLEKMKAYSWPGNIRELENVLEKAAILCDKKIILPEDLILPEADDELMPVPRTLKEEREHCERQAILKALNLFHGDKLKAAQYLDIGRTAMFDKIRKYGITEERCGDDDFR